MKKELPKVYEPQQVESGIYQMLKISLQRIIRSSWHF